MESDLERDITFIVEEKLFKISKNKIPKDSHLDHLVSLTENKNVIEITSLTKEAFRYVFDYLNSGILPNVNFLFGFEYMLIPQSYELSCILEEDMRKNMYSLDSDKKYEEKYYGLRCINEEFWTLFKPKKPKGNNFLFSRDNLIKRKRGKINKKLLLFKELCSIEGVFIAGGAIFSCLFEAPLKDIDIFLYGCNEEEAIKKIYEIKKIISSLTCLMNFDCIRTENAITFYNVNMKINKKYFEIQIILRLYKTPSEIIHGFDVDSCCMGYDGKNIWVTERALFSLENGYNTINFNRLSPSYEYRLAKYGSRGMAIKIPNFSVEKIKIEKLKDYSYNNFVKYGSLYDNYEHLLRKKGLDILIFLDHKYKKYFGMKKLGIEERTKQTLEKLEKESSDYSPVPFTYETGYNNGSLISNMLVHLECTSDKYPEYSEKYMSLFGIYYQKIKRKVINPNWTTYTDYEYPDWTYKLYVNSFFLSSSIFYIKGSTDNLPLILNIPENVYNIFSIIKPWKIPQKLEWKITNPGEQMTNTFHQIVLEDNSEWYKGEFY